MLTIEQYTIPQLIMISASELPQSFTEADLAVASWNKDPDRMGLPKHPHPDNNKLRITLMGKRGLIRKGLLVKVGPLTYRISEIGKEYVQKIQEMETPRHQYNFVIPARLALRQISLLGALRERRAYRLFITGGAWSIDVSTTKEFYRDTSPIEVHALIKNLGKMVEASLPIKLHDGEEIGPEAIDKFTQCHTYLLKTHGGRLSETPKES